ncbi:MAG TPA: phosphodiester glycosidase family protein [Planctomycetota bacterium]|nr:phosphodiester glycosidase family protein [Planctomycetota bacterium]
MLLTMVRWLSGAESTVDQQLDLPQGMGTARRMTLAVEGGSRPLLAVTLVPGSYSIRLMDQSPTFPVGARTVAQSRSLVPGALVAINGGYFEPSFQPSGLFRLDGKDLHPLAAEGVLSGIVALDVMGGLRLLPRDGALDGVRSAIQAGPFLIDPGGTLGVNPRPARAQRSVIATDDHGRVLVLATGVLTLHQVASLLHDQPQLFGMEHIERALNLDGGPSTGLSLSLPLAVEDPAWSVVERGPVRNVLVVSPAAQ